MKIIKSFKYFLAIVVVTADLVFVGTTAVFVGTTAAFAADPAIQAITHAGFGGGTDVTTRMMLLRARRALK